MKTTVWIAGGLTMTGAATLLSYFANAESGIEPGIPTYLPTIIAGALGQFCFWRAIRSAIGDVWSATRGGNKKVGASRSAPDVGISSKEDGAPESDFDADAAFARYMARRSAAPAPVQTKPAIPSSRPTVHAHAHRKFGRRAPSQSPGPSDALS